MMCPAFVQLCSRFRVVMFRFCVVSREELAL